MGKKGYALVEAVTAVALVMMASGILSLGISFWPSYGETGGTAEEYRDGPGGPGALQDADRGRNRHIRRGLCAPPDSY